MRTGGVEPPAPIATFDSQGRRTFPKVCEREECGAVFYDRRDKLKIRRFCSSRCTGLHQRRADMPEWRTRTRHKHKQRTAARRLVRAAVLSGKIVPHPCKVCGRLDVQSHHRDYSKPLEIVWLCVPHHRAEHNGRATGNVTIRAREAVA